METKTERIERRPMISFVKFPVTFWWGNTYKFTDFKYQNELNLQKSTKFNQLDQMHLPLSMRDGSGVFYISHLSDVTFLYKFLNPLLCIAIKYEHIV